MESFLFILLRIFRVNEKEFAYKMEGWSKSYIPDFLYTLDNYILPEKLPAKPKRISAVVLTYITERHN